jgi:hypothetical protein
MNTNYPTLPAQWSQYLIKQPETGMGYQIVDIELKDGRIIKNVAIIQSSIIGEIKDNIGPIPFNPEDIIKINITHNKWKFNG